MLPQTSPPEVPDASGTRLAFEVESPGPNTMSMAAENLDAWDVLTTREATFSVANSVIGVGVLSIPYAFRLGGVATPLLIVSIVGVTAHTAKTLGASLTLASNSRHARVTARKSRDYGYLAFVAFGERGRKMVCAAVAIEIWLAAVAFVVMTGKSIPLMFPALTRQEAIWFSTLLATITCFVPMRVLSYLSLMASLAICSAAGALVGSVCQMDEWATSLNVHIGWDVARSIGIILFCFAGHPCFPTVHQCMQDPSRWDKSVHVAFLASLLYYGSVGVCGFVAFGHLMKESFVESIADVRGAEFWRDFAVVASMVKIQLSTPRLLQVVMVSMWAPAVHEPEWSPLRVAALILLAGVTAIVACIFAHQLSVVTALSGNLCVMFTSVIFPTCAHLRLASYYGRQDALGALLVDKAILLMAGICTVVGTTIAASDLLSMYTGKW